MPKFYLDKNVLEATKERIEYTFDNFKKVYVSFSAGKDSTVMLHLVADEARKRGVKFGCLIVDLEGQYKLTIEHIDEMVKEYEDVIDLYWVCLPIHLRNAVSVYEPFWMCWDKDKREDWIRELPEQGISDESYFEFFSKGMEFEEFVPEFGEWYSSGEETACLVGIRSDESLNRYRTISSKSKEVFNNKQWTTKIVTGKLFKLHTF